MKVIVLGAGVVGVTSAWFLAAQGHEVEVVDRRPGAGLETSFANAGQVSPGYSAPWAGPGVPQKAVKWLLMAHGPLVIRPRLDPLMWRWLAAMLGNCTHARYALNKGRMVRLAEYSRDVLRALRAETGIAYDGGTGGTLQLFRTQAQLDHAAEDVAVLEKEGVAHEVLDTAGCVAAEPGLAGAGALIKGGLRLPGDETGDCHLFTRRLAALAEAQGVRFRYGVSVERLATEGRRVTGVVTSAGTLTADSYVVALANGSPRLMRPLGLYLPVLPVKGYSLTLPVRDAAKAPRSTVMDETYKVAITRLGERIRVGGTAEIGGVADMVPAGRRATLEHSLNGLYAGAGDVAEATAWGGFRPMTPDGTPIIGATPFANLHLNTGHGTLGWTMSCGSARVLADLVSGREPDIAWADLGIARYGKATPVAHPAPGRAAHAR
ncbi:D-amino acid dehydrogenase [Marinivivus vitaminiproducens]|uniref:D-amino acid dehydrogenase n=1 Tax=Marinivivus vitaminiproducens TaxID=3035935 RepID=UPI0027AAB55D|nr:D-amino acid dehydrogenase [Geminicoccaceae bacterium SCSIO 64248]